MIWMLTATRGTPPQMRIHRHDEYHDANAMSQQPESQ